MCACLNSLICSEVVQRVLDVSLSLSGLKGAGTNRRASSCSLELQQSGRCLLLSTSIRYRLLACLETVWDSENNGI
jgi:hypothetical protein